MRAGRAVPAGEMGAAAGRAVPAKSAAAGRTSSLRPFAGRRHGLGVTWLLSLLLLVVALGGAGRPVEASLLGWLFPARLTVGAFNVQAFGQSKAERALILRVLATVICRYDVLAVQEIRDTEHKAVERLLRAVNHRCPTYGSLISPRAGSTSSQEQIAYFYRMRTVEPLDTYQSTSSRFERPPFVALFQSTRRRSFKFVAVAAHLKPKAAAAEMQALHAVFEEAASGRRWGEKHRIEASVLMGDLNADCGYITRADWQKIKLRTDPTYHWLIEDGTSTMVATQCTYDRIIVPERHMGAVVPQTAAVDHYQRMWSVRWALFWGMHGVGVSDISDHFPVRFQLTTSPRKWKVPEPDVPSNMTTSRSVSSFVTSARAPWKNTASATSASASGKRPRAAVSSSGTPGKRPRAVDSTTRKPRPTPAARSARSDGLGYAATSRRAGGRSGTDTDWVPGYDSDDEESASESD